MQENDNDRCLPQLTSILKAVQRIFTIRISAKKRSIGEGESAGSPIQVNFKVVPTIIPAKTIVKPHSFPDATGALGDVWRCSMSTLSGTRQVSLQILKFEWESTRNLFDTNSQSRSRSKLSGSLQNQIKN
ncbi:hypothetical protein K503DRAFT_465736 [Rhizopogon vinicolor AM-OR11-026]|uniref:Uncharacterized protein n=1 Tax=Rhizopogon vinicolor AM-OR11-026 TaxID=1314800 RepID=A0A1B7MNJ6_9AGAM|nr:hypothetical protein K503DRAFT_465736 [Rhizopogon vinicolor AM-OR11-026]